MRPTKEEWYIGIEAGRQWMQISCYHAGLTEPETKSTLAGSEVYLIPTAVCKRKQSGQWCFGEEGRRLAESTVDAAQPTWRSPGKDIMRRTF